MNEHDGLSEQHPNRWRRVTAVTAGALLAGLLAIGVGGVASAQTVITETSEPVSTLAGGSVSLAQVDDADDGEGHMDGDLDISAEDEAVFERFEQCLRDAGLDFDSDVEPSDEAYDAAFEQCDPILDGLSDDFDDEFADLSPEDEAVFERYDTCLEGAGLDFESEAELDEAALDAAFEQCDPILDELSAEAQELLDCDEHEDE